MVFEQFVGIVPSLIVAEGDKVQVKCHVVVKGVPADLKKPIALCPSSNGLWRPVETREDSFEEVDLCLKHFLCQPLEGANYSTIMMRAGVALPQGSFSRATFIYYLSSNKIAKQQGICPYMASMKL